MANANSSFGLRPISKVGSNTNSTGASDGITTAKLATNAVTTVKITDANVTAAKVAANAVTVAKVADEGTLTQSAIKRSIHKAWVMGG